MKQTLNIIALGLMVLFAAPVQAEQVTFAWTAPVEVPGEYGAATGYKIYVSNQPGIDPANPATYLAVHDIGNVLSHAARFCRKHHYFVVTAYNDGDVPGTIDESGASNEVDHYFPNCPPQSPVIEWLELMTRLFTMRFM